MYRPDSRISSELSQLCYPSTERLAIQISDTVLNENTNPKIIKLNPPRLLTSFAEVITRIFGQDNQNLTMLEHISDQEAEMNNIMITRIDQEILDSYEEVATSEVLEFRRLCLQAISDLGYYYLELQDLKNRQGEIARKYLTAFLDNSIKDTFGFITLQNPNIETPEWRIGFGTRFFMWYEAETITRALTNIRTTSKLRSNPLFNTIEDRFCGIIPDALSNGRPPFTEYELKSREERVNRMVPEEMRPDLNFRGDPATLKQLAKGKKRSTKVG